MTSYREKRCAHCQSLYWYQSSGWGCQQELNDGRYCRSCQQAVVDALCEIPVRFRCVWEETDEVDISTLLEWRETWHREQQERYPNRLIGERVVAPLFDLQDPENRESSFVIPYEGKNYLVRTWSKTPEKNCVKVEMEEEIATGNRRPWRDP